jgi:hypothetical protein
MTRRHAALACALLVAACAAPPRSPEAFAFGVMGDTPYNDGEEKEFVGMIGRVNTEALAFVVHVGDIKNGVTPCSDALYARRKAQFDASRHPFIYTPGDNEWTDCRWGHAPYADPIERLARLRQEFFDSPTSLGARRIDTAVQESYPENRRWTHANVVFVTLNVPGSNNNVGYDSANNAEAHARDEANRRWLLAAVDQALADGARALVVLIQANPWRTDKRAKAYAPFLTSLEDAARRFARPVLFVHGDTHTFQVDAPLTDSAGRPVVNVTRLETYGSPFVGWVKVTVDPADPQPFAIEGRLLGIVPDEPSRPRTDQREMSPRGGPR